VLETARLDEGVERLKEIQQATLERSAAISMMPRPTTDR